MSLDGVIYLTVSVRGNIWLFTSFKGNAEAFRLSLGMYRAVGNTAELFMPLLF